MTVTVCLSCRTLGYPQGGGHRWVYLNWALGLAAAGCRVIWLETLPCPSAAAPVRRWVVALRAQLKRYSLSEHIALAPQEEHASHEDHGSLSLEDAANADLLLNLNYGTPPHAVRRFRRTALVDIDPGLLQVWLTARKLELPRHDVNFTIGETVGQPGTRIPDAGLEWHYTAPAVALEWWPVAESDPAAPFTTVSHWRQDGEWMADGDEYYSNEKRSGFLPFLDLPRHVNLPLELALCLAPTEAGEASRLRKIGWRVRDAWTATATPWRYRRYVQESRGEFSCAKPSCVRLQNAWISDRTICYLASGKPAVVQHTGPSRFLPDAEGLIRFRTADEAREALETAAADYRHHSQRARQLAETYFDSRQVVKGVLERALA